MDLLSIFNKGKRIDKPEEYKNTRTYNYDDEESRIATAEWLFSQAKNERTGRENDWRKFNDYYNGRHDVPKEIMEQLSDLGLPSIPAVVPDPYIMVESQICPDVPQPEFHGRDSGDGAKAERRQKAVKYVLDNNRINDMNTANERRLRKYGDAFWKAWWDKDMPFGEEYGDIRIKDIPIEDIYVDPTATKLEEAEYVDYVYTMHKMRFWRIYGEDLKKKGLSLDDVLEKRYRKDDGILDSMPKTARAADDLVQIMEHWFKQPCDGDGFVAGDIACSIQAGSIELRYIPCYWERTHIQNKSYPFVHYWCIGDETGFYNRSEIDPIISLTDSADRELATSLMNDEMMSNDIILMEDGAMAQGYEPNNNPGSVWTVRQGKMNSIRRLGGLNTGMKSGETINWLQNQMQRANRNYDTNNGQESARITTASGLLQLRSDAAAQGELKKADRNKGFCRLYELIDWLCLEFYTDFRMLYIGADETTKEPEVIAYDSSYFASEKAAVVDMMTGETILEGELYFPRIDVTVTCGDGISKNPASTIQILDKLASVQVTADNWKLIAAELDYLDIPQKQEIVNGWKEKYESEIPEEVITALKSNPQLLNAVQQITAQAGTQEQAQTSSRGTNLGSGDIVDDGMNVQTF